MQYVGRIDPAIYSCITLDIATDEVVITDKQLDHILVDHPEREHAAVIGRLSESVQHPDYILRDPDPRIAVVLKSFRVDNEQYRIILKLACANDDDHPKNSILTAFYISGKKIAKYLRNKEVLYSRSGI